MLGECHALRLATRETHGNGARGVNGETQRTRQLRLVGRSQDAHVGKRAQICQVEGTMVGGSVLAYQARAVDGEDNVEVLQAHVGGDLVIGALQERGVDGHHGHELTDGQAARHGDGALLGDADVEETAREPLGKSIEARARRHGRSDGDNAGVRLGLGDKALRKDARIGGSPALGLVNLACGDVEGGYTVERLGIGLSRRISQTLFGDGMDDDGLAHVERADERLLEQAHVMAIDRAKVGKAHVFEEHARDEELLRGLLGLLPQAHKGIAHLARTRQTLFDRVAHVGVCLARADSSKVARKSADRARDAHLIVVEDDNEALELLLADIVERLVRKAAGNRGVAHHGDDVRIEPLDVAGKRQAQGSGQRIGGMASVMDVVGALRTAGKSRDAAFLAQMGKPRAPAREKLVRIGLMAHVEQELVFGQVKHAMRGEDDFDRSQGRSQVAAVDRGSRNHLFTQLLGQLPKLVKRQVAHIIRFLNAVENL